MMSTDGGVHFTDMTGDARKDPRGLRFKAEDMHPDQHAIAFVPDNPSIMFVGSDGGIIRTSGQFADDSAACDTRGLSGVDPARQARHNAALQPIAQRFYARAARGDVRWSLAGYPSQAAAQEAGMSLGDYEDFVFRSCHVLDDDPVGHWRRVAEQLGARANELAGVRELRVVGEDTDLTALVEGRTWRAAHGRQNMPDGEVYTSPIENGVNGTIRFGFPAVFGGREIDDIRLRFADGRVVDAEAAGGDTYLSALLEVDEGARGIGELAFGLNYEIDRFTRNILFDEKIGGTIHLALGMGFENLGGLNRSSLHLDLICDLREEGEVYADGELVWRDGKFLHEPEAALVHAG
jgi:aminopeptidase